MTSVPQTYEGLERILREQQIELRRNVRGMRVEVRTDPDAGVFAWLEMDDDKVAKLRRAISERYTMPRRRGGDRVEQVPWKMPNTDWDIGIGAMLQSRRTDPFLDYVQSLEWDGLPRAERLLATWFPTVSYSETAAWASRHILGGAVSLAAAPGLGGIHTHPVLIGPQGCGKSSLLAYLLPPERRHDWLVDSLRLDMSNKEFAEAVRLRVLAEFAEMTGLRRAQAATLKAILSSADDGGFRPAYGRHTITRPRRCVLVFTANPDDGGVIPRDPGGYRRYGVIEVSGDKSTAADGREWLDAERGQLWAEAWHRYSQGEDGWAPPRFPDELAARREEAARQHSSRDRVLDDQIADLCPTPTAHEQGVALADILAELGITDDNSARQKIGGILKEHGWDKRQIKIDGQNRRRWFPPIGHREQ